MLWYNFAFLTPFSCLALVLLICGSSLVVILVICVRLMSLMGHLVLFLLLLVRLLRGSTKHAWYAVFSSPCPTSVWYMSAQGSLVAVLKETSREVRGLHRLLCTPHVSFSNVWQMEQDGRWEWELQDKVENGDGSSEFACVPVGVRCASQCRIHTRWRGCVIGRADFQLEPQISTQKMA